jgi:hypothetical protein
MEGVTESVPMCFLLARINCHFAGDIVTFITIDSIVNFQSLGVDFQDFGIINAGKHSGVFFMISIQIKLPSLPGTMTTTTTRT